MPTPACSQTSETPPLRITLQPSRWALRVHWLLVAMAAAALLLFSPVFPIPCHNEPCDPSGWQLPLWWGLWLWLALAGQRRLRRTPDFHLLLTSGELRLGMDDLSPGEPLRFGWSLHPWLLQLRGSGLPAGGLLLWPDSATPEALRRLRVQSLRASV